MQKTTNEYDLAIVGAGAAGLFACALIELLRNAQLEVALARPYVEPEIREAWLPLCEEIAFYRNLKIVLLEGQKEAGRKLCLTGGGRCNLASQLPNEKLMLNYHEALNFLRPTWQAFSANFLRSLLFSMGISTYWDEIGRLYPVTNSAKDVRNALLNYALQNENLSLIYQCPIQSIKPLSDCSGWLLTSHAQQFTTSNVIFATGGYSVASTGSNGELANFLAKSEALQCSLVKPKAALAPFIWQKGTPFPLQDLAGISLHDIELNLELLAPIEFSKPFKQRFGRKLHFTSKGDLLITKQGLSGPAVLNLSRFFAEQANFNKLTIKFLPDDRLSALLRSLTQGIKQKCKQVLSSFLLEKSNLPKRLVHYLGQKHEKLVKLPLAALDEGAVSKIAEIFTWQTNSFVVASLKQAQVTSGGISLSCINPQTLALKTQTSLFLVGEIMNVDACCGGFNLLHAFATSSLVIRNLSK